MYDCSWVVSWPGGSRLSGLLYWLESSWEFLSDFVCLFPFFLSPSRSLLLFFSLPPSLSASISPISLFLTLTLNPPPLSYYLFISPPSSPLPPVSLNLVVSLGPLTRWQRAVSLVPILPLSSHTFLQLCNYLVRILSSSATRHTSVFCCSCQGSILRLMFPSMHGVWWRPAAPTVVSPDRWSPPGFRPTLPILIGLVMKTIDFISLGSLALSIGKSLALSHSRNVIGLKT